MDTELIERVKNNRDFTWEDKNVEEKITRTTERAKNILYNYAGTSFDIEKDSAEEELLFDLIRYILNDAYEDFKINFQSELISLRLKYQCQLQED